MADDLLTPEEGAAALAAWNVPNRATTLVEPNEEMWNRLTAVFLAGKEVGKAVPRAPRDGDREYANAEEFAKHNPLGGVAKVFECMADRIRTGESLNSVLQDYGFQIAADPQEAVAAIPQEPLTDEQIISIRQITRSQNYTKPWGDTLAFARAVLAAADAALSAPSQVAAIPRQPTPEMISAAIKVARLGYDDQEQLRIEWKAMYDAAPQG